MSSVSLNFGQAVEALKRGHRVARRGWNGKGMFVYLDDMKAYEMHVNYDNDDHVDSQYDSALVLFTALGTHQVGWNASTPDVLAEDWCILDDSVDCTAN